MRFTFVPSDRHQKAIETLIREAPGQTLFFDDACDRPVGRVKVIERSEGGAWVAECVFSVGVELPEGLADANARNAPQGFIVGAKTLKTIGVAHPENEPLVGFFLRR